MNNLRTQVEKSNAYSTSVEIKDAEIPTRIRQVQLLANGEPFREGLIVSYNRDHEFSLISRGAPDRLQFIDITIDPDKIITAHREVRPNWITENADVVPWSYRMNNSIGNDLATRAGLLDVLLLAPEYKGFQLELLEELVSVFNVPFFIPRPAPKT